MSDTELQDAKVKLSANGDLTITEDGNKTVLAHYDRKSAVLEFVSKETSAKYYNQCVARISTVAGGTQPSQNVIRSIAIKGQESSVAKDAPKRPRLGPLGDSAEEFVQWMLDYNMSEAIARYGIYVDEKGQPVRKNVRRKIVNMVDVRDQDDDAAVVNKQGKTQTSGPVGLEGELVEVKNAIIARRATALTFTPSEVIGGYVPDDYFEQPYNVEAMD